MRDQDTGAAVEINAVTKRFGNVVAVADFSLEVQRGELVTLLGPSGCGKTTTLRIVAGFERPDSGRVFIFGREVTHVPPERRDVGMVFQNYALFPHMTVFQNVAFPMRIAKRPKREICEKVREYLALVRLEGLESRYVTQLSGGQKQRVALARALARSPKILLLDEPLSALDAKIRVQLREEIRQLQQRLGITTLYVTHDQEEALSISDRVVVMNEGNIEQIGAPVEIYFRPRTLFVASFVGTMNFFTGKAMATEREVKLKWHEVLLSLPPGADVKPGETISVGVRPERLSLAFDGATIPPGHNVIPGEVSLVTFLGSIMRVEVMLADGTKGKIDLPTKEGVNPQRGQKVYLYFSPGDAVVLKTQGKGGGSGG
ncbi:MAG: ABC transporter ATP-binding protein [Thaumarchaeota archaeon]|nr:MAG: ABC transporter ATP-binding protein [Nitrososphaerota archaeon]